MFSAVVSHSCALPVVVIAAAVMVVMVAVMMVMPGVWRTWGADRR
jgi:hypothetical protein